MRFLDLPPISRDVRRYVFPLCDGRNVEDFASSGFPMISTQPAFFADIRFLFPSTILDEFIVDDTILLLGTLTTTALFLPFLPFLPLFPTGTLYKNAFIRADEVADEVIGGTGFLL